MRLRDVTWPLERLDEAVDALARAAGLIHQGVTPVLAMLADDLDLADPHAVGCPIESLLSAHGLEIEPCTVWYRDVERLPAPVLVRIPGPGEEQGEVRFAAVAGKRRAEVLLVAPTCRCTNTAARVRSRNARERRRAAPRESR